MSRIIQILDSYFYGDGIGNHTTALHNAFCKRNIESLIYARFVDPRLSHIGKDISEYESRPDDTILLHLGAGSEVNRMVLNYNCRIIMNYHNITPAKFFEGYNEEAMGNCRRGMEDLQMLRDKVSCVIADSQYNASELEKMGYTCPMYSVPIIMKFDDYDQPADQTTLAKYDKKDGITNIVFVGRIAPNKKQEDIIRDFYYYTKYYNPKSRLILAGNMQGFVKYGLRLKKYAKKLGLKNVVFPGHVQFQELLAYYQVADVFLCESDHEGFCIPLVEAMYFGAPIIAGDSSAVGETLGTGGILLPEKNPQLAAALIDQVVSNDDLRKKMAEEQKKQLERFSPDGAVDAYVKILLA